MIDPELRRRGIGGSEISSVLGLNPRRDAWAVWADKTGRSKPNPISSRRMRWGKRLEQAIIHAYVEETGRDVEYLDETVQHQTRRWQVWSPDAKVRKGDRYTAIVDAKNVSLDQSYRWGDAGTDDVPVEILLQMLWYLSAEETLPRADVAALFGGNDLRIFPVHRNAELEATLLEEGERFWVDHVLADIPPPIGPSPATVGILKGMFPEDQPNSLRPATPQEIQLLLRLKDARHNSKLAELDKLRAEAAIKLAIAEAEGIEDPMLGKVTWKRCRDQFGTDWESVARDLWGVVEAELLDLVDKPRVKKLHEHWRNSINAHRVVLKEGSRRLNCPRTWNDETEGAQ